MTSRLSSEASWKWQIRAGIPTANAHKGDKHKSWRLAVRHKGKRKMIHIPHGQEDAVSENVKTYQELWEQLEAFSQASLERILPTKKSKG